jgi:hypothetical protein
MARRVRTTKLTLLMNGTISVWVNRDAARRARRPASLPTYASIRLPRYFLTDERE